MNRILVIGDSWASAYEVDTGRDAGWPEIIGADYRQGVNGSTAGEWAADSKGRLTRARQTEAGTVIVSLLGNDARNAAMDGVVTLGEIAEGLRDMRAVVEAVRRPLTIVLLYADPFFGESPQHRIGIAMLNHLIRLSCRGLGAVFADTGAWLGREHFVGEDIHPTRAGHAVIAGKMQELIAKTRGQEEEGLRPWQASKPTMTVAGDHCKVAP